MKGETCPPDAPDTVRVQGGDDDDDDDDKNKLCEPTGVGEKMVSKSDIA
jgi:hypothetical protein